MKTQEQAAAKWVASTATGEQTWIDNLNASTKPIVTAAIAQRPRMQANFATATQPGGSWEKNLSAVGDAGIKAAATAKRAQYTTGINNGKSNFDTAIGKVLAYEQAGMAGLNAIPKGGIGQSVARATYWIQYMAAGRGKLGAR